MPPNEGGESEQRPGTPGGAAGGDRIHPSKPGLTLGFAVAGILVVLYAARTHPVFELPLDAQFGLLQLLPATYWLGLALIGVSVVLAARGDSDVLFVAAGVLLFGMLAGTPILFEPNPPVWDAYTHYAGAEFIVRTGRLPTDPNQYAANWPGLFLVIAFTNLLGSLTPLQFIELFPFFSGAITFVALFLFLRSFFSSRLARSASVVAMLLNVWAQYWVSPQGVGLALALLVLATAWDQRVPVRTTSAVIFLALVVSHSTSTIFLLAFLGVDGLLVLVGPRISTLLGLNALFSQGASRSRRSAAERRDALRYNPFFLYLTAWLGWLVFVASGTAELARVALVTEIGNLLQLGARTESVVTERTLGNIFVWAPRIRVAALALFGLLALVGLAVAYRKRQSRGHARFLAACLVGVTILALADILLLHAQIYDRALMFFAVFAPGICLYGLEQVRLRSSAKHVVIVILVVGSLAAASTLYYQEAYNFVPNQVIAAADFYSIPGGKVLVLGEFLPTPVWVLDQGPSPWSQLTFGDGRVSLHAEVNGTTAVFAGFDPTTKLWYDLGFGVGPYQYFANQQANYSRVYDNGFVQAYLLYSPPS